jgi:chromosome segregation ATPase
MFSIFGIMHKADMARLEADAAGEVAAHASLAGQLKDLRSTSDSLIAARNVTIRSMNEKIIFLENTLRNKRIEQTDIQKMNGNIEISLSESQGRINALEKNERNLLAKLQAREAEIEASNENRLKLKHAIDNEAGAKMKQKSLAAENKKLKSRLEGAFERIRMLEERRTAQVKESIVTSEVEYNEALMQVKDLEYQLEFSINTINELRESFARANSDREVLAQKIIAIESENAGLERERTAAADRLRKVARGNLEEAFIEEIEAEAERKIDKFRKRIQEETDLSQQMSRERLAAKHQIEMYVYKQA